MTAPLSVSSCQASARSASSARSISLPASTITRPRLVVDVTRGEAADQVRCSASPVGRSSAGLGVDLQLRHRHLDELLGAAVLLTDDHVLGDVDQPAGQVARVRRTQRRVGQSLASPVGRDEVLEHGQALHEVGLDRTLDDLALRIGHQAAHTGQLADLRERAAGTRVGHHGDRVEVVEVRVQRLADLVGGAIPQTGDRLVALLLGDLAVLVLSPRSSASSSSYLPEDLLLGGRGLHVVLGERHPGARGVLEADVLERVEHLRDRRRPVRLHEVVDQLGRVLLAHRAVDELVGAGVELVAQRLGERALDLARCR